MLAQLKEQAKALESQITLGARINENIAKCQETVNALTTLQSLFENIQDTLKRAPQKKSGEVEALLERLDLLEYHRLDLDTQRHLQEELNRIITCANAWIANTQPRTLNEIKFLQESKPSAGTSCEKLPYRRRQRSVKQSSLLLPKNILNRSTEKDDVTPLKRTDYLNSTGAVDVNAVVKAIQTQQDHLILNPSFREREVQRQDCQNRVMLFLSNFSNTEQASILQAVNSLQRAP
ncbi:MAG: hypothetical protein A3D96_03485 [Chlamydiae bacterium RIFCSPHIGHO2_12_FULL_44_59]|nr:MAG: hypothetical protein A2796_02170 [Chlamydiae bacterium RIFCSPHIGHO2_01_FULL_44_39]OGN59827.1 MAG: hypothetical protein A3D96_03485 [Chlamydiae bacterium RIFCSPHIGHO2_12_FULL_44_59]OGN66034.1 MAG: hypothetical protein A2978_04000 [Chlamydiae bacterium RIFCSPLOWO2_01_FULL_44_52]OGN68570.1 MAG: hypothetical protein A3I67_02325 [Chlamydiae bacterium RIFCSPLOWO2_02_FULL_45_22]OGN69682.1 MAG: hypothetical protein A3F79_01200 [Chlamydiae bacterium RIFCSPLOWO2_12_FULL_45_20]